jgi:tRNA pseudouridine55 synthase
VARSRRAPNVDGFLVVDKPAGMTSHDVVARCRKVFGQRQVGHGGTLDPDATGVLVLALGAATRLLRFVADGTKRYRATIVFGIATDTLDASGHEVERIDMHFDRAQLGAAVAGFVGVIEQVPPMVSALKVDGRRLHELAREGIEVERTPRRVTIHDFEVEAFYPPAPPSPATATVVVECSGGTYIRTLAADLGAALGGVAHVGELRRLAVGRFNERDARTLVDVEATPNVGVLSIADGLLALDRVTVDDDTRRAVAHGATLPADITGADSPAAGPTVVCDTAGDVLAVYEPWKPGVLKPAVVLAQPGAE